MRLNRNHIVFFCLFILAIGCKKNISELNVNPNDNQIPEPALLFKHSVRSGMSNYITSSNLEYNGISRWVMHFAVRGGINTTTPYISPSGGDAFWSETYVQAMNNAQVIIDFDDSNANLKSCAIIWKTFLAHRLTDLWGSIPYSDALEGNPELNFTPAYDTQEEIYSQMLLDLKNAAENINEMEAFVDFDEDLLFNGDLNLWKRFANSLRFRLAMRISNVNESMAQEILSELLDQELIESNSHNAAFQFNSVFNKPLFEAGSIRFSEGAQYLNPSKFLVDFLLENQDPRIPFYLEEASLHDTFDFLDKYKGVPNLLSFNSPEWENYNLDAVLGDPLGEWGDVSRIGKWFMNNDRAMPILSYSEMSFLKAEAAFRGMWPGNHVDYFEDGVRSHMEHMNEFNFTSNPSISESEISTYITQFSSIGLEEIGTQKWLLFAYENTLESFAEYRRTGFPILRDFDGNALDSETVPSRIVYPNSEFAFNRDNYLIATDIQGPDNLNTNLWWDQ